MNGWTRLKLVLSITYWSLAGLLLFLMLRPESDDPGGVMFGVAMLTGVPFAFICALVWAVEAILRGPQVTD